MIVNLFSVFDPTTEIWGWSLNWLTMRLWVGIFPLRFWRLSRRLIISWNLINQTLHKEFRILIGITISGVSLIFIGILYLIVVSNFLGLFSHIFTGTRHLVVTLTLSLPLWLSCILFGWVNHTTFILAHLVPQGTPPVLIPFIVCIETIRNLIRPRTLAVRLIANIIAGHLLLTLLRRTGTSLNNLMVGLLVRIQTALLSLEIAVAIIQSYVFAVLGILYLKEAVH